MLGVKYVSVPSSGHTMVMTSHQATSLKLPQIMFRVRKSEYWFCRAIKDWQLETMREQPSLEWLCPNPSAVSSPGCWHVTLVTSEAGPGPSSDPGARPLGADTELLKDEMDWYERIAVYCVLTSILQTRHYLSLTQTPETPLMPSRRFHWFTF